MRSAPAVHAEAIHGLRKGRAAAAAAAATTTTSAATTSATSTSASTTATSATSASPAGLPDGLDCRRHHRVRLHAANGEHRAGRDRLLAEPGSGTPHGYLGHARDLRLRAHRSGRDVLVHVPDCGELRVPLHATPLDDGDGQRQHRSATATASTSTTPATTAPTATRTTRHSRCDCRHQQRHRHHPHDERAAGDTPCGRRLRGHGARPFSVPQLPLEGAWRRPVDERRGHRHADLDRRPHRRHLHVRLRPARVHDERQVLGRLRPVTATSPSATRTGEMQGPEGHRQGSPRREAGDHACPLPRRTGPAGSLEKGERKGPLAEPAGRREASTGHPGAPRRQPRPPLAKAFRRLYPGVNRPPLPSLS